MKISVKAKPSSREEEVIEIGPDKFIVSVMDPPVRGLANQAIIRVLAQYFSVPKSQVKILSGWTSRQKVLEIIK